jgi:hypothetical protein
MPATASAAVRYASGASGRYRRAKHGPAQLMSPISFDCSASTIVVAKRNQCAWGKAFSRGRAPDDGASERETRQPVDLISQSCYR